MDAVFALLKKIAYREGFGDILAEGSLKPQRNWAAPPPIPLFMSKDWNFPCMTRGVFTAWGWPI